MGFLAGSLYIRETLAKAPKICHNRGGSFIKIGPGAFCPWKGGFFAMPVKNTCALLLAGEEREKSGNPRSGALSQLLFRPLIRWVWDNCTEAGIGDICVIAGEDPERIQRELPEGAPTVRREALFSPSAKWAGADGPPGQTGRRRLPGRSQPPGRLA